jgi:cytochrome bd-type quinol oxidase subunit 2
MKPGNARRARSRARSRIATLSLIVVTIAALATYKTAGLVHDVSLAILILAALVAIGILVIGVIAFPSRWRKQSAAAAAWRTLRCLHCNYDLRGLQTPTCPECGRESEAIARWLAEKPELLQATPNE